MQEANRTLLSISNIIIMGFGKMPTDCAKILLTNSSKVSAIIESEHNKFSPLEGFCQKSGIPFHRLGKNAITDFLASQGAETIVLSINNNYLFPDEILNKKQFKVINFHNSLLPSYRGHGVIVPVWAVYNGESRHGVTWHRVNSGIDTGNILCQEEFAIAENDTALTLMMRSIEAGIHLFSTYWSKLLEYDTQSLPQSKGDYPQNDRTYKRSDLPNIGFINTEWDYHMMSRFLRSMDYGPFRLLPEPKIIINDRIFRVEKYEIKKGKRPKADGVDLVESPGAHPTKVRFNYEEGTIQVRITNAE